MADNIPSDHLDLYPGPTSPISPPNAVRITTTATGIQASVNGAAAGSVGGSTPTTFGAYFSQLFQNKTGLSPLSIVPYVSNFTNYTDNVIGAAGSGAQGGAISGTGAAAGYNTLGNGIITLTGPTSGAGFADLSTGMGGGHNQIANARTKKWLVAFLIANGHAPGAASESVFGILVNGATYVGIGFVGALSTWRYVRGAGGAVTSIADTGLAIDSTDLVYKWMYVRNDATNIIVCPDVLAGAPEQTVEASSNIGALTACPYFTVHGTGASDKTEIAGYTCFSEF